MKLRCYYSLLVFMALTITTRSYSQEAVHSGILHTTAQGEEFNLLKIHCDELVDKAALDVVQTELGKYPETIITIDGSYLTQKIYIKYSNAISPNMILGILERVYLECYYLDSAGNPIHYEKSGNENFRR